LSPTPKVFNRIGQSQQARRKRPDAINSKIALGRPSLYRSPERRPRWPAGFLQAPLPPRMVRPPRRVAPTVTISGRIAAMLARRAPEPPEAADSSGRRAVKCSFAPSPRVLQAARFSPCNPPYRTVIPREVLSRPARVMTVPAPAGNAVLSWPIDRNAWFALGFFRLPQVANAKQLASIPPPPERLGLRGLRCLDKWAPADRPELPLICKNGPKKQQPPIGGAGSRRPQSCPVLGPFIGPHSPLDYKDLPELPIPAKNRAAPVFCARPAFLGRVGGSIPGRIRRCPQREFSPRPPAPADEGRRLPEEGKKSFAGPYTKAFAGGGGGRVLPISGSNCTNLFSIFFPVCGCFYAPRHSNFCPVAILRGPRKIPARGTQRKTGN